MATDFDLNQELEEQVTEMLGEFGEFNAIEETGTKIYCCSKVKMNKDDELVPASGAEVELKKLPPLVQFMTGKHYALVVCYHWWQRASEDKKKARLHSAIMQIDVSESPEDGVKRKTRQPDVVEFSTTVARFGAWNSSLTVMSEAIKSAGTTAGKKLVDTLRKSGATMTIEAGDTKVVVE